MYLQLIIIVALLAIQALPSNNRYYEPSRALLDPEIAQIPEDILICYDDRRLITWNVEIIIIFTTIFKKFQV